MDLSTVEVVSTPTRDAELWPLGDGDAYLAGGTWLFSEPQPGLRRLVDITALSWPPITLQPNGIELAATCTLAEVSRLSTDLSVSHPEWRAASLFHQCCTALLASPKIWRTATIGGNICLSLPAGAMISLASILDGQATVWCADGSRYTMPVTEFVTGSATNVLAPGDVLRSVHLHAAALRARAAFRKLAPSPSLSRRFMLSVTAATVRPYVFTFPTVPDVAALRTAHASIPDDAWTCDAHGDPDWRRAVTLVLAEQICTELT